MKAIQSIPKILYRFISIVLIFIFIGNNDAFSQSCAPPALFSAANISTPRCHNQNITFTNPNALPGAYRFRFYSAANVLLFGPDVVLANGTVSHPFASGLGYKAVLVHQDATCKDSIVVAFNVDAYPAAPAFTNNGPKCANTATGFTVTGPIGGLTYSWTFGDPASGANNSATGTTANHVYPIASNGLGANYNVVLTATSLLGCATSGAGVSVPVKATPKINLSDPDFETEFIWKRCQTDGNSVDSIYTFRFDNHSLGSAGTSYKFTWGDGTPNTTVLQNSLPDTLTHLYASFGVKNGTLQATDPNGCTSIFAFKVVNEKFPSASLSIPPPQVSICDGTTVTISNNSINATNYTWLWGDGDSLNTTSKAPQSHLYKLDDSVACKITVATGLKLDMKLKAFNTCFPHDNTSPIYVKPLPRVNLEFDSLVCVDSSTNLVTVPFDLFVCPNRMMTSNFTTTTIIFNDPFASPPSNPDSIVFNPNIPLTNISHQFRPGVYNIVAKAKNGCGTTKVQKKLVVRDWPKAKFQRNYIPASDLQTSPQNCSTPADFTPTNNCVPFSFDLKNLSTGTGNIYTWTVTPNGGATFPGTGNTSTKTDTTLRFTSPGTYTITLKATNPCGTSLSCATVTAIGPPVLTPPDIQGINAADGYVISGDTSIACEPKTVDVFTTRSDFPTYAWTLTGTGSPVLPGSNTADPGAVTLNAGVYTVTLTGSNICGSGNTKRFIKILSLPIANAGPDVKACLGNPPVGIGSMANPNTSYQWNNLDGGPAPSNPNISNPTVSPSSSGIFRYELVAKKGPCTKSDTVLVTINPKPTVTANDAQICKKESLTLSGSPAGGTWRWKSAGPSLVNPTTGIFNTNTPGIFQVKYFYKDPSTLCEDSASATVTIFALPNVKATDTTVCNNAILQVQLVGFSPISGGTGIWTNISGPPVSTSGQFTPSISGNFKFKYFFTDVNGCVDGDTIKVAIVDPTTVEAGLNKTICLDSVGFKLRGFTPKGGKWFGPGMLGTADSSFNPRSAGVGIHKVIYSVGSGLCLRKDSLEITVLPLPPVDAGPDQDTICINDGPIQLATQAGVNPPAGTPGASWSGPGVSGTQFTPSTAGVGTHIITYRYKAANGCDSSETKIITVNPLPTVFARDTSVCRSTSGQLVQMVNAGGSLPGSGRWVAVTSGFNITSGGAFNPNTQGIFQAKFIWKNDKTCEVEKLVNINVTEPTIVEAGINRTVCVDSIGFKFTGFTPKGGKWSGPGLSNSTDSSFNPRSAGIGTHIVKYTLGTGLCLRNDSLEIIVLPLPPVDAGPDQDTICITDGPIQLATQAGVNPPAGTPGASWSGPGVSGTQFTPSTAGVGTHIITYRYKAANGCDSSDTKSIIVNPLPTVFARDTSVCRSTSGQLVQMANAGGSLPGSGRWIAVTSGFTISSGGAFNPNTQGIFQAKFIWKNDKTCEVEKLVNINVTEPTIVEAGINRSVCLDSVGFKLTGFTPKGGIWSGPGLSNSTDSSFNPRAAGIGTHIVSYTLGSGLCLRNDSLTIIVLPLPDVNAGPDQDTICINDTPVQLASQPGVNPTSGGVWTGPGVSGNQFDPVVAGIGTHIITFRYKAANGCDSSDTKSITVNPLPTVFARDTSVCRSTSGQLVQMANAGGSLPGSGRWVAVTSGFTITSGGAFNPNTQGIFQAKFIWKNDKTCEVEKLVNINVTEPTIVEAGINRSVCLDSVGFKLTGFTPKGGIWSGPGLSNSTDSSFNPRAAGIGTHIVRYTLGSGLCLRNDSLTIIVLPLPDVNAGPDQDTICINDTPVQLTSQPGVNPTSGGVWTGPGVSGNQFDPVVAGLGTHTITFRYKAANGCDSSDTKTIIVNPLPTVFARDTSVCRSTSGQLVQMANAGGSLPGSGRWVAVTSGFTISSGGAFNPNTQGIFQAKFIWKNDKTCEVEKLVNINITEPTVVEAGPDFQTCIDSLNVVFLGFTPKGGVWSGTGSSMSADSVFFPRNAGIGTHKIIYTVGSGLCLRKDSLSVTVNPLPNVNAGPDQDTVCINDAVVQLASQTGVIPVGGLWFGIGVTDPIAGIFNPQTAGLGSHTIIYRFRDVNGCDSLDTKTITVNPLPNVFARDTSFCRTTSGTQVQLVNAGGDLPGTGRWSDNASGLSINPDGTFIPATVGIFQVKFIWKNDKTCESEKLVSVNVTEPTVVEAGPDFQTCIDSLNVVFLGFTPKGGIWSGTGSSISADSVFFPRIAGIGTHKIIYTVGSGLCLRKDSLSVTVNPLPNVNAGPDQDTVCINDAVVQLASQTGVIPVGGLWSGIGVTDPIAGIFNPQTAGLGSHTITYRFRDVNGCDSSDTKTITVNPLPNVFAKDTSFCRTTNATQVQLVNAGGDLPGSGRWDDNASGLGINPDGTFIPATVGVYLVKFIWKNDKTCESEKIVTVTITEPTVVEAGPDFQTCIDSLNIVFQSFTPKGGIWSGTGSSMSADSVFIPRNAGIGTHKIIYTVGSGLCLRKDSLLVTVNPLPNVNAGPDQDTVCINDVVVQLASQPGVIPVGGLWSGIGVTDPIAGIFNPQTAGLGSHTITYRFRDANGCDSLDTKTILVNPLPNVFAKDTSYCRTTSGTQVQLVNAGGDLPGTGRWDDNTSGIGINPDGTFIPATVGVYLVKFIWKNDKTCESEKIVTVSVIEPETVVAGPDLNSCLDSVGYLINGFTPKGGIWTGPGLAGSTDSTFNPRLANAGTHQLFYTVGSGLCLRKDSIIFTVHPLPDINAGPDQDTVCINDAVVQLASQTGVIPVGGLWSGNGVTNSITGTFNPQTAGVGSHTITYRFRDVNGCDSSDTKTIVVNPLPNVFAKDTSFCRTTNATQVQLVNAGGDLPGNGRWDDNASGLGINPDGTFIPATVGVYLVKFIWKNDKTCESEKIVTVSVIEPETVVAGPDLNSCLDSIGYLINGFTPKGGIWTGSGLAGSTDSTFNPRLAGAGTHELFYTVGSGLCLRKDSIIFTVNPLPDINAGPDQDTVCINDAVVQLASQTGVIPVGGLWSGNGVTDPIAGIFNPQTAGVGSHTITYRFRDINGCDSSDTKTIVVNPLPNVFARDTSFCRTTSGTQVQLVNAGGDLPGNGRWDDNASGLGINPDGTFIPATVGVYLVKFIWKNEKTCESEKIVTVSVIEPETVVAGPDLNSCLDSVGYLINGFTPKGGIWTGPGLAGSTDSTFNPRLASAGTHQLFYTVGSGLCLRKDSIIFTVHPLPDINAGPDQDTVCINDAVVQLASQTGVIPVGGLWSGNGVTNSITGTFNPQTAGVGSHTITYRFRDINGCDSSDTKTIVVNPLPNVFAKDTSFCRTTNATQVQLVNAGGDLPGNGRWDDNASGLGINPDGTFIPATVGVYLVKFIWKNEKTCERDSVITVRVTEPEAVLAGPDLATCLDSTGYLITGFTPKGGVWTGSGMAGTQDSTFLPRQAGIGTHKLIYTVGEGLCLRQDSVEMTVLPLPIIDAGGNQDTICINDSPFDLNLVQGAQAAFGASWSIISVDPIGGNASLSPVGIFTPNPSGYSNIPQPYLYEILCRTVNPITGCDSVDKKFITVNPKPKAKIRVTDGNLFCINSPIKIRSTSVSNILNQNLGLNWDLANGLVLFQTPSLDSLVIAFPDTGVKRIILFAQNDETCGDADTILLHLIDKGIASYTKLFNPASQCGPVTVTFKDSSSGYRIESSWDLGNGVFISKPKIFDHFFPMSMWRDTVYQIRYKLVNHCDTIVIKDSILVKTLPVANISANGLSHCPEPNLVTFSSTIIGAPTTLVFDFGDGTITPIAVNPANLQETIQHGYVNNTMNDLFFTVKVTAINTCPSSSDSIKIKIRGRNFNYELTADDTVHCDKGTTNFSTSPMIPGVTVRWDLGDGTIVLNQKNVSHEYTAPGVYRVKLTSFNECHRMIDSAWVHVYASPLALIINPKDTSICMEDAIQFVNGSSSGLSYEWYKNNETLPWSFSYQPPVIQLNASGVTKIRLIVKDPQSGCFATDSAKVTVRPGLRTRAKIEAIPNEICPGDTILIRDLSENRQTSDIYTGDSFFHPLGPTKTELKYTYFSPGTYSLYLIAFGQCVNDTSDQVQVKVNPVPRVGFLTKTRTNNNWIDTVYICIGDTVWYSNLFPTQAGVNYSWNFGDNTGSSSVSPQPKQYNVAGLYLTTLQVVASGPAGCDSTRSIWVKVKSLPNAFINGSNNTVCQNGTLSFQNASTNFIQHRWKVLDPDNFEITPASQAYNQTINIKFNQAGLYTIRLITSNTFGDEGCRDSVDKQVTVFPSPIAKIQPDTSFACLGDFVQFSNLSSPGMAYLWKSIAPPFVTWTNGINQFIPGPTPNFNTAGIYRFELRVTDPVSGCRAYDTAFVDVNSTRQAVAAWTIAPLEGCDSLKITIRDNSVFRDSSRVWFSNGTVISIPRPTNQAVVRFFQPDTIQAFLVAYGKCTLDTTESKTIRIRRSPKANFWASTIGNPQWFGDTITICKGETVQFINQFPGVSGLEHNWAFGDGGPGSALESPQHTYNQTGLFSVDLKETYLDPPFCQASKRKWVLVKPQPQAVFTGPAVACVGIPVSFQNNSLSTNSIRWYLMQGNTVLDSVINIPTWTFSVLAAGNYTVRLKAYGLINSSGCISSLDKPLLVHPKPNSNFIIQDPIICLNDSLRILNSSEPGLGYLWYLDNSTSPFSTLFNPSPIQIATSGQLLVRLKVINPGTSCYSWDTNYLNVSNVKKTIARFQVIPPYQGCDSLRVKFRNLSIDADSAWVLLGYNNLILPFTSGNPNAEFTYPDTGRFKTHIIALGQCNRDTSEGPSIRIWPSPQVGFYASTTLQPNWITDTVVICVNDTVRFHNSLPLQNGVHYRWKFSESGTFFNGINPDRRKYLNPGFYGVTLQAISDSGICISEERKTVWVKPLPVLSLNISPNSVCAGSEVELDGTNTQHAEFFRWEITEGDFVTTIDTAAPIIHYTFLQPGNGNTSIRLIAYNSASRNSCFSEITKSVIVRPKPTPRITMNDSLGCTPLTISFSRNPENFGGMESVSWNFGDNRTSTSKNLSLAPLIYTNPDTIEKVRIVKLKVVFQGCSDSATRKVRVFPMPKTGLSFIPGFGPNLYQVNPLLKMQEEVMPTSSQWVRYYDFGDGKDTIIIGGPNTQIEHRYDTTGIYTVKQKVMDWRYPDTCAAVFEQNFISVIQSPPIADFKVNGKDSCSVCEDDTVTFTNKSRFVTQSSFWSFGNGRTLRLTGDNRYQSQKVVYPEPGIYQVSLTVKNERGVDTLLKKASVIVNPKPKTSFSVSPNIFEYPIFKESDPIRTVNKTIGGSRFLWNFGENLLDTLEAFDTTYKYTIPGEYTISLVSISDLGCPDTFRLKPTMEAFLAGLWVPDVFNPGSSVIANQYWKVFHRNAEDFEAFVYNQWGEQIFYTRDLDFKWDGTFEGRECPNGSYNFVVRYRLRGLRAEKGAIQTISKVVTIKR